MEIKISKEIPQQRQEEFGISSLEDKSAASERQGKLEEEINPSLPQPRSLIDIINEQNYFLTLDEEGKASIDVDCVFVLQNNSNLIIKLLNGSKISKNACLITSLPVNAMQKSASLEESGSISIKKDEVQENISQIEAEEKERVSSVSTTVSKKSYELLIKKSINSNNITIPFNELKEISKYYDLKNKNFYDDNKNDTNNNINNNNEEKNNTINNTGKINSNCHTVSITNNNKLKNKENKINLKLRMHEKFNDRSIQEFGKYVVLPIVNDTDLYFIIPCKVPGPLTFFVLYEADESASTSEGVTVEKFTNAQNKPHTKSRISPGSLNNLLESQSNNSSSSFDSEDSAETLLERYLHRHNLQSGDITVLIEPRIEIGNKTYDIENLSMQTILSKSLGKIEEWENYFKEASLLNYNFIHFTPVQMIGSSDSLYCLKDQTEINDSFFDKKFSKEEKYFELKNNIEYLKQKYHINSLVDIVLNHTAANSDWIYKHPDAGYNLENCPYLTVSYELDRLLLDYSHRFSEKKVSCKSAPFIYNENDLTEVMGEISNEINKKNFEEFFLVNIDKNIGEFVSFYKSYKKNSEEFLNKKKYLNSKLMERKINYTSENDIFQIVLESADNFGAERYGVNINCEFISILLIKEEFSEAQFLWEVKRFLQRINEEWRKKTKEYIQQAIENLKAGIRYEFIQLKRFKVTEKKKLVENYFVTFEPNNKKAIFACNGWLFGVNDPTINFAKYGFWNYFNRSIVIWGDCIKLNFGDSYDDSPYLWEHMTEYVISMAKIFDGFRLDNAHSTPIFLAEYLIKKARQVNPNLVIIAELFAGTKEREIDFVKKIGINLLIREIIYSGNPDELCEHLYKFGGGKERILGKLNEDSTLIIDSKNALKYKPLLGRRPKSVIYDITHDNPTLHEKFSNLGLNLSYLCCNSMSAASIGSTRGFDQLFPYQPSVVKENRLYKYNNESFESFLQKHQKILGDYSYPQLDDSYQLDCDTGSNGLIKKRINKEKENTIFLDEQKYNKIPNNGKKIKEIIDNKKEAFENLVSKNNSVDEDRKLICFEFEPFSSGINYVPSKISLAISSNNWKPDIMLEKISNNLWRTNVQLKEGVYEYKYIIDNNTWTHDKTKPTIKDKSNNINNQISIGVNTSKGGNMGIINVTSNISNSSAITSHEFYTNQKDLKLIRREMNYMRRFINEKSNAELSEFFIHKDRDVLFIYRSLNNSNSSKALDFNGYAFICRTGYDTNPNSLIQARIELPGVVSELVFFSNISIGGFDLDSIRSNDKLIGVESNLFFSKNIKNLWDIAKISKV